MKVSLGQLIHPSDFTGTIVDMPQGPKSWELHKKRTEELVEPIKEIFIEKIRLKREKNPVPELIPMKIPPIVKVENVINPGKPSGYMYVDGKLTDEQEVFKELVPGRGEETKSAFEEFMSLIPLGGMAMLAFAL